ncbi:MAG: hypothetical protein VR64_16650 [Desulfatitalea sp. BRH_c12]|nr:MAG: hypothetical protein VR64_16650 [Desulfatitalea sp. BRH_c12]
MVTFFLIIACIVQGRTDINLTGKLVKVSDGDTFTILENRQTHKIRLYGIDTPERRQNFGNKARQFTAGLVWRQNVRVVEHGTDRYGRIIGMVYVDDVCVNEELVKQGLAWVYPPYCTLPICDAWTVLEAAARDQKLGLWGQSAPIAPWNFRRSEKHVADVSAMKQRRSPEDGYLGNQNSLVFHQSGCRNYRCINCVIPFPTRQAAIENGFRPCGECAP